MKEILGIIDDAFNATLYVFSILVTVSFLISLLIFNFVYGGSAEIIFSTNPCPFKETTGFDCMFCGGTHALNYLLSFDLVQSVQSNTIVLTVLVACIVFIVAYNVLHKDLNRLFYFKFDLLTAILTLWLTQFLYKNFGNHLMNTLMLISLIIVEACYFTVTVLFFPFKKFRNPFRALYVGSFNVLFYYTWDEMYGKYGYYCDEYLILCYLAFAIPIMIMLIKKLLERV